MRVTPECDSINSFFINNFPGIQREPAIVHGGNNYLVAWSDERGGYPRIFGCRVTSEGIVLEPNGTLIGPITTNYQHSPSVSYNGTRYFVVWGCDYPPYGIYGRFVDTTGIPYGDTIRIAASNGSVTITNITFNGEEFFVAWIENSAPTLYRLKARRVSGNSGSPIGDTIFIVDSVHDRSLGLRWDGYNYLITFSKQIGNIYQVFGCFYSSSGVPTSPIFNISNSNYPSYYCDLIPGMDNRYLNVWTEIRTNPDVYGNIDIQYKIEEICSLDVIQTPLFTSIVTDVIELNDVVSKGTSMNIYDPSGRLIGSSKDGRFDCSLLNCGVYFVRTEDGKNYKIVKIR
ncbi:MAG: hypothetical protein ABIL70_09595 [candidate division WOR-3 bacterium]